jgi:hypothetical protein
VEEIVTGPTPIRPGWYPDPDGGAKQKYWTGREWKNAQPSPRLERRRKYWAEMARRAETGEICARCHRVVPEEDSDWEAFGEQGNTVVVCPECITPKERQAIDEADMELMDELRDELRDDERDMPAMFTEDGPSEHDTRKPGMMPAFLETEPGSYKPLNECSRGEIEAKIMALTMQAGALIAEAVALAEYLSD